MIRSLYTSVSSLISLENRQSVITNNMANANTTGFKSDNLSIKSFDEVYIQNRDIYSLIFNDIILDYNEYDNSILKGNYTNRTAIKLEL